MASRGTKELIFGVPTPVARSYFGVSENPGGVPTPLLFVKIVTGGTVMVVPVMPLRNPD